MSDLFLHEDELVTLTGRRMKSRQIEYLRAAGIPFRVNATGHPVVTRAAMEGRGGAQDAAKPAAKGWQPKVIAGRT